LPSILQICPFKYLSRNTHNKYRIINEKGFYPRGTEIHTQDKSILTFIKNAGIDNNHAKRKENTTGNNVFFVLTEEILRASINVEDVK